MPYNATFDANQFEPKQMGGGHPIGNKFEFEITNTEVKPTKDGTGGLFVVTFTTPAGQIDFRYNLFNASAKAVEIAHGQFSALCRAVGQYQVDFNNDGAALRGKRGRLDVGYQKGEEPTAEKPEGGYVEVKRVYDINGIEPGKTNAGAGSFQQSQPNQQHQPQVNNQPPANQPMVSQPGGGWGNSQPQPQTHQQPPQGWQQPQGNQTPQQQVNPQGQQQPSNTWQPGQAQGGQPAPWGNRT